jgi:type VI secretion system protein ImpH
MDNAGEIASNAPWKMNFLGLLRQLGARHPHLPQIGHASRPREEPFRIGQRASLIFAPREIAAIDRTEKGLHIELFGLGMLGPNGPLPIHMTEWVRDRLEGHRDATVSDFLNIFHHRALTQFYQAWATAQAAAGLDRADEEVFSRYICWLSGNDPAEIRHGRLPAHAILAASAHHVRESRNPDGVVATLSHFFGVRVRLEEFVMHWIVVDPGEYTRLASPGSASGMGHGAMLGDMVPDRQHRFRLEIGPLTLQQYLDFTPNGRNLPVLVEWVRAFFGYEFSWEVALLLLPQAAPAAALGAAEQLGWSTWLGTPDTDTATTGMVFEPDQYATG